MSDNIVVVDNGSTYETQESAIVAKSEADRAEQWAKYSEEKANLADERAVDAAESSDAAAQAATAAIEAKQYAETAITDENLIVVATDLKSTPSNIKKTAGSIDNVNTVGKNINNVNAVAANKANIDKVAADKDNIDTVATNIVNVNTVAKNIDNVNLLAPHTEAMEALAPDIMDVVTVAGIAEQTKNVSENMAHVVAVDNNKANIDKAVANATNITTVATSINNVNAVADNKANIDNVAANKTNINNVSANITAVNNVSDNMTDVKDAVQSANDAKLWAVGTITEKPEGSSKYWAEQSKSTAQISDASESVKGIVRLATDAEAKAGLNNETAITPKKLQDNLSNNVGRINQLGFNGTLESGVITFVPDQGTYELKAGYEYEIDLLFSAVGSIPDTTQLKIVNGDDTINIVNVLDSDYLQPTTYGAMKQVCRYDTEIGWRWIFNVRYSVASDGSKVFVMPATTVDMSDKVEKSSIAQNLSTPSADTVPSTTAVANETKAINKSLKDKASLSKTNNFSGVNIFNKNVNVNANFIIDGGIQSSGNNTFTGNNTFSLVGTRIAPFIVTRQNSDKEGGEISFEAAGNESNNNNMVIDRYDGTLRVLGQDTAGNYVVPFVVSLDKKAAYASASGDVNAVLTTINNQPDAVLLGNGLILNWGSGSGAVVFKIPFSNTNYAILDSDQTYHKYEGMWTSNKSTTGFNINNSGSANWLAIGR